MNLHEIRAGAWVAIDTNILSADKTIARAPGFSVFGPADILP